MRCHRVGGEEVCPTVEGGGRGVQDRRFTRAPCCCRPRAEKILGAVVGSVAAPPGHTPAAPACPRPEGGGENTFPPRGGPFYRTKIRLVVIPRDPRLKHLEIPPPETISPDDAPLRFSRHVLFAHRFSRNATALTVEPAGSFLGPCETKPSAIIRVPCESKHRRLALDLDLSAASTIGQANGSARHAPRRTWPPVVPPPLSPRPRSAHPFKPSGSFSVTVYS